MKVLANTTSRTPNTQYIATRDGSLKSNWLIEKHHVLEIEKLQVSIFLTQLQNVQYKLFRKKFHSHYDKSIEIVEIENKNEFSIR